MSKDHFSMHDVSALLLVAAVLVIGAILGLSGPTVVGANTGAAHKATKIVASVHPDTRSIPTNGGLGYAAILKPALSAVVNISSSKVVKMQGGGPSEFFNDPFFQQFFGSQFHNDRAPREERERSLGSGVIVQPNGYILTNNHVIEGATEIKVFLPDKREFIGKVVGSDSKTDLAVVKINAQNLPTITFGDSSKIQVGDLAFAIGDPFGIGETATMGIISATGRNGLDIEDYEDFIQTDAAINPGNSGGALVDARGDLIGVNTAIITGGGGGNQGVGFAIPIDMAHRVMNQIMKNGKVVRGYLGVVIQEVTPELAKAFKVPENKGALIGDVSGGSPADKAGLQKGDVIEQLNGQNVESVNDLRLQIASAAPGTTVHLTILRNGDHRDVAVTLSELPAKAAAGGANELGEDSPMHGVQVRDLTASIAHDLGLNSSAKGVVVTDVADGTPAADAGLRRGDLIEELNHHPVTDVSRYQNIVREAGKQELVLLINRGGETSFLAVEPE